MNLVRRSFSRWKFWFLHKGFFLERENNQFEPPTLGQPVSLE
jgi:hypothetical protein